MTQPEIFAELAKKYPLLLTLEQTATILNYPSVNAIRIAYHRGTLPVRMSRVGGHLSVFLVDVAEYLHARIPQTQPLKKVQQAAQLGDSPKRGRPTTAARVARRAA